MNFFCVSGNPQCPVLSFRKYTKKLNNSCEAFWQRPGKIDSTSPPEKPWYQNAPCGHNTLGSMMQKISKQAGLSCVYTNHSIRATCITLLDVNGWESRHIMGISKHKSETSIRCYSSRLTADKRAEASDILSNACQSGSSIKEKPTTVSNPLSEMPIDVNSSNVLFSDSAVLNQIQEDANICDNHGIGTSSKSEPDLLDFLTPSQEDQILADACSVVPADLSHVSIMPFCQNQQIPGQITETENVVSQTQISNVNTQQSLLPFNMFNYGTVNIYFK